MDLFIVLWETFSMNERPVQDLIKISSLVDEERSGEIEINLLENEFEAIAGTIVALLNNRSTAIVGEKFYNEINKLVVQKNLIEVNSNDGENLYKELKRKDSLGTYKVIRTNSGYQFNLVSSNEKVLAVSEIYSTVESCMNGIVSMQKNIGANIEDQTVEDYMKVSNPKYEIYCDRDGDYRFRLKAMNGLIIAVSGAYSNKDFCLKAIEMVKFAGKSMNVEKG